jgi:hypothetical protein
VGLLLLLLLLLSSSSSSATTGLAASFSLPHARLKHLRLKSAILVGRIASPRIETVDRLKFGIEYNDVP